MSDETATARTPEGLGPRLKAAREAQGLSLSDVAQRTHVRRAYLEALEEGRFADLPEDVYSRNFVRLYAQCVGLAPEPLTESYLRERRAAMGTTTLEQRLDRDRTLAASPSSTRPRAAARAARSWLLGPWVMTLALVIVVVALAAWGFDRLFATGTPTTTPTPPAAATAADPGAAAENAGAGVQAADGTAVAGQDAPGPGADATVRIDVVTNPPGAVVTIDGFPLPGRTPLAEVPVSARSGRVVRAELEGYEPAEARYDLVVDGRIELTLTPIAPDGVGAEAIGTDRVALTITEATWLEVYRSDARNVGERLVYTTAQPGTSYEFALPVFVYVGNAAGVRVNLGGQDLGPMGGPGAVLGRAFGP